MARKLTTLLRWMVALAFVGVGVYFLAVIVWSLASIPWLNISGGNWNWFILLPVAGLCLALVLVPFGMGYLVFRRRYHELCSVLALLTAIVMFFLLSGLPRSFGWYRWLDHTTSLPLVGLFVGLLFLFGPIFAAVWLYRMCLRLADRYLAASKPRRWQVVDAVAGK